MARSGANNHQPTLHHRIVALLFALAAVAEYAATLPAPIRFTILFILRRAEPVAYAHVYWELNDCGLSLQWLLPDECREHSDANAAMMLGRWLRILAISLRDVPRRAHFAKMARAHRRLYITNIAHVAFLMLRAPLAADTS